MNDEYQRLLPAESAGMDVPFAISLNAKQTVENNDAAPESDSDSTDS